MTPGSAKHSITLTGQDDGKGPIVKDLLDALTQATGVPPTSQKLIFKGTVFFVLFFKILYNQLSNLNQIIIIIFVSLREITEGHGGESVKLWS